MSLSAKFTTAIPCRIKHVPTQEYSELKIRGQRVFQALHEKVNEMTNDNLAVAIKANINDSGSSLEEDWRDYRKDAEDAHFLKAFVFRTKEQILHQVG